MPPTSRSPGVLRGTAFGVVLEIRVDDRRLLPAIRQRCPPGFRRSSAALQASFAIAHHPGNAPAGLSLSADGVKLASGLSHEAALDMLESEVQLCVARLAQPQVFIHAGVVAVDGRAIVLPGTSGAGKTTLVRALIAAGATYYSDEYAVLDTAGRVHPYPRRPSVRMKAGWKRREAVPRRRGRRPIPIGIVIQTEYSSGARWRPVSLSPGEQVMALLSHAVAARERPRDVLATLARAVSGARGFRSERGAARSTALFLVALAARPGVGGSLRAWRSSVDSSRAAGGQGSSARSSKARRSSTSRRPTGRSA